MSASLNFIILKVNDIDVSNLSQEEAVQIFLKAEDPIIVEVRRRTFTDVDKLNLFDDDRRGGQQQKLSQNCYNRSMKNAECQTDSGTELAANSRNFDCCHLTADTQNLFIAPEIDIEEITLRKSRSDEKLGFTVSYSSGNGSASISTSDDADDNNDDNDDDDGDDDDDDDDDTCADIYISDIMPDSLAARDGRLRQGDQIIQINGRDVSSKDETESLFAENKNAITLLVSRCLYTDDEFLDSAVYCDDKDPNAGFSLSCDCEQSTFSSKSSLKSISETFKTTFQPISAFDTSTCDHANIQAQLESVNKEISLLNSQICNMKLQKTPTHAAAPITPLAQVLAQKSSSCALRATRKNEIEKLSVEQPSPVPLTARLPYIPEPDLKSSAAQQNSVGSEIEHIYETIPEESETDSYYCSPYESKDQSRIEQWLKSQEGRNSTSTALMAKREHYLNQATLNRIYRNNSSGDDYENSSSAYNTGGSCNSNPLTCEMKSNEKNQSSSTLVFRPYSRKSVDNCKQCQQQIHRKDKLSPKNKKLLMNTTAISLGTCATTRDASIGGQIQLLQQTAPRSSTYTNVEEIHQTIKLQNKLFRKTVSQNHQNSTNSTNQYQFLSSNSQQQAHSTPPKQTTSTEQKQKQQQQLVWKVKRRTDGTRYIVRRPARQNDSTISHSGSSRVGGVRLIGGGSGGVGGGGGQTTTTTEDETISEPPRFERYWTTRDKRHHNIQKLKERRHQNQSHHRQNLTAATPTTMPTAAACNTNPIQQQWLL